MEYKLIHWDDLGEIVNHPDFRKECYFCNPLLGSTNESKYAVPVWMIAEVQNNTKE